jgi:hypothetical protein
MLTHFLSPLAAARVKLMVALTTTLLAFAFLALIVCLV